MNKILTIISGLPGGGKSTIAYALAESYNGFVCEADMYFTDEKGNYNFDPDKLGEAHKWCQMQVEIYMNSDMPVFVCNTSLTLKEIKPYKELARKYGYKIHWLVVASSPWESVHKVPEGTLRKMARKLSATFMVLSKLYLEKSKDHEHQT